MNALVALIRSQPGMAERLLAVHVDDGSGRCRVCSAGGFSGRYAWPCVIQMCAAEARATVSAAELRVIGRAR